MSVLRGHYHCGIKALDTCCLPLVSRRAFIQAHHLLQQQLPVLTVPDGVAAVESAQLSPLLIFEGICSFESEDKTSGLVHSDLSLTLRLRYSLQSGLEEKCGSSAKKNRCR